MLVLSRRKNEEILFPELGITVEVIQLKGSTVRLGIKAPQEVLVLRGELSFEQRDSREAPRSADRNPSHMAEAS